MQPRVSLAHRLDRRPAVDRTLIPQENDMAPQVPQEHSQAVGHVHGLEVARLYVAVQA